ncbi:MAG: FtsX-like permease family protein, partial [Terriglobales bacterium]
SDATSEQFRVIVNRRMAALYWPGQDPVGRTLGVDDQGDQALVIGVVEDSRDLSPVSMPFPQLYYLFAQGGQPSRATYFLVKSSYPSGVVGDRLRHMLDGMSSAQEPVFVSSTFPLADLLTAAQRPYVQQGFIWGAYAIVVLCLCGLSLFGISRWWATVNRRGLAVRLALGAPKSAIAGEFLRQYGFDVALGIAVGCALALIPVHLAAHFFYGNRVPAPAVWLAAASITVVVCALAVAGPAVRACRIDVGELLRID